MRRIRYIGILLMTICMVVIANSAHAQIKMQAPEKVARGDAFVAQVESDEPVQKFVFFWRGKNIPIQAKTTSTGGSTAEVLLPVPLDEKAKKLTLSVGADSTGKSRPLAQVNAPINIYERKRPVQKLTVDKKFVNPPAAEMERIKADREKV